MLVCCWGIGGVVVCVVIVFIWVVDGWDDRGMGGGVLIGWVVCWGFGEGFGDGGGCFVGLLLKFMIGFFRCVGIFWVVCLGGSGVLIIGLDGRWGGKLGLFGIMGWFFGLSGLMVFVLGSFVGIGGCVWGVFVVVVVFCVFVWVLSFFLFGGSFGNVVVLNVGVSIFCVYVFVFGVVVGFVDCLMERDEIVESWDILEDVEFWWVFR